MVRCSIICVGTELVTGKNLDTNSPYLSREILKLGYSADIILKISDDKHVLSRTLKWILKQSECVILTGGLGPTSDDVTKDAVKDALKLQYVFSQKVYRRIGRYFRKRGRPMPENNKVQAFLLKGSRILNNRAGTAPGCIVEKRGKVIILLPGPPAELRPMFEEQVKSYLKRKWRVRVYQRIYRLFGLTESGLAEQIKEHEARIKELGCGITYLAKPNLIDIILTGRKNVGRLKKIADELEPFFQGHIYSRSWKSLYETVARQLKSGNLKLALAESCTGGLIAKTMTDLSGSSAFFLFDVVSYSNKAKENILRVKSRTLSQYGAVSRETAREMLDGLEAFLTADLYVSVTGIAGPSGGTPEKPVGLVYIGTRYKRRTIVEKYFFPGNREYIRDYSLNKVFELIYRRIHDIH
ncbi:MAG: competence/damage-inducible protein A [bacterium]|nr:competence/damage-inducible protein A [bacterium]